MAPFPYAHATHPQWQIATELVLVQLRAQMAQNTAAKPTLGLLYITDHFASCAQEILAYLQVDLSLVSDWCGTVGVGIAVNNVQYWDEPALAVMLLDLPRDQYRVFSDEAPLPPDFEAHTALVHASGDAPDLNGLIEAMAARTGAGYVFGGVTSSRSADLQFAISTSEQNRMGGIVSRGLSGVALGPDIALMSEITQGCIPIAPVRQITAAERNMVLQLDGEPALDALVSDLELVGHPPHEALEVVRTTLVGLQRCENPPAQDTTVRPTGNFGDNVVVRHIVGLDPQRSGILVSDLVTAGSELVFCRRDMQSARADLTRICAEIREELESQELPLTTNARALRAAATASVRPAVQRMAGALYISCTGRGGPYFGDPNTELQIIRRVLGDVPLVGFFAAGEIARTHLYGYTGILTVFLMN
ncbi:MAG: FIST C-terminal domain-containing protein [Rhodoferax sp.]|nr:FIST C-terminal domain-containing protein [Rhodoferax sp.]